MATILNDAAYMGFPLSIKRGNPAPVDTTAVWYNKIELEILTEFILSTEMLFGTKIGFSKTDMKKRYSLISKLTSFERIEKDF